MPDVLILVQTIANTICSRHYRLISVVDVDIAPKNPYRPLSFHILSSANIPVHFFNQCMRFPTMWYVRPAKAQISLRIRAVWSEPLLVALIFYECQAVDRISFGVSKLNRRLQRLVWVYICQNVKLLEISCHGSNLFILAQTGDSRRRKKYLRGTTNLVKRHQLHKKQTNICMNKLSHLIRLYILDKKG